jgi:hypothetical protein
MKHLKLFEELISDSHSSNTNIDELDESFINTIKDICFELDDIWPTSLSFHNPKFRKQVLKGDRTIYKSHLGRFLSDYPSIRISEDKWRSIYGYQEESRIWTKSCVETANRIKDYLGDNYKLFIYTDNGTGITKLTPDLFKLDPDFKYGGQRMRGFEIVYDPSDYQK